MSDHTLYSSASAMSRAFGCWRQPTGDFHVKLPSYVKVPCGYRLIRRGHKTVRVRDYKMSALTITITSRGQTGWRNEGVWEWSVNSDLAGIIHQAHNYVQDRLSRYGGGPKRKKTKGKRK